MEKDKKEPVKEAKKAPAKKAKKVPAKKVAAKKASAKKAPAKKAKKAVAKKAKKAPAKKAKKAPAKKGAAKKFELLIEKHKEKKPIHYKMSGSFNKDDVIDHDTFGVGIILGISNKKIEVLFSEQIRILVCER